MPRFEPISLDALASAGVWSTDVPIRFGDCDPAGIVYTPEYLNIFNGVIEDWYGSALGIPYHSLIRIRKVGLGYAHVSADFSLPSSMGDILRVAIIVAQVGRSSLTLSVHAFNNGIEAVRAQFVTVTTEIPVGGPIAIPDDLKLALQKYQTRYRAAAL